MRHRFARSLIASLIVLTGFTAFADDPPSPQADIQWTPATGLDHQLFPSAIVSTATANLSINLSNVPVGSKVHATVSCDSLLNTSSVDIVVPKGQPTFVVPITANWKFDKLPGIRQQIPANFTYSLTIDGRDMGTKVDIVHVHSINDCVFEFLDGEGKSRTFFPLFAAYVDEGNPGIDKILKTAIDKKLVGEFDGYQSNDAGVVRQVAAVWETLQLKGIKYSDITDTPNESKKAVCQYVRFFDEAIDNNQANCVDGSVLIASILKKIGINVGLVIKPKHMFIMFYTDAERKHPIFLETTALGREDIPLDPRNNPLENLLDPSWKKKASYQTFVTAVKQGTKEAQELLAAEQKAKAAGNNATVDVVVNIEDARKRGIMPIPSQAPAK